MRDADTPFKIFSKAMGLTDAETALLLRIPLNRVKKYNAGAIPVLPAVMDMLQGFLLRVDDCAAAFADYPERLDNADIPALLRRAVRHRIIVNNALQESRLRLKPRK